jgi:hypothetical protein
VLLQEALLDPDHLVRATAAVVFSRPGVIDATVSPCLRNLVMITLDNRAQKDDVELVRTRAKAALDLLMELKFYTTGLPPRVVCPLPAGKEPLVPFDPGTGPNAGRYLDKDPKDGAAARGSGWEIVGAVVLAIGVGAGTGFALSRLI